MFLGVFRVFRHSSPFVAQALPLPVCVIMGDELAERLSIQRTSATPALESQTWRLDFDLI